MASTAHPAAAGQPAFFAPAIAAAASSDCRGARAPLPCGVAIEISRLDYAAALLGDEASLAAHAAWLADVPMSWLTVEAW